jgi:hypothetical protein
LGENENANYRNRSGFLAVFLFSPDDDQDANGVVDEDDADDDGDGLSDVIEITGTAFLPTTASDPLDEDSDGDGMSDAAEAAAGTNPRDPKAALRITDVSVRDGLVRLSWRSRGGYRYSVRSGDDPSAGGVTVTSVLATGGIEPWYETTTTWTNAAGDPLRFYRVNAQSSP